MGWIRVLGFLVGVLSVPGFGLSSESSLGGESPASNSSTGRRFLIGHNFTPTSYTLPKGQFTAGTYALGVGVTDWLTVATSPWLFFSYNMPMISVRVGGDFGPKLRGSLDLNYFHSLPILANRYDQRSTFTRLVGTYLASESYRLHLAFSHQWFIDGLSFYSLHLFPGWHGSNGYPTSNNLTFSGLNEVWFSSQFGMFLEAGLCGINYPSPFGLLAASVFWRHPSVFLQLGVSYNWMIAPEVHQSLRADDTYHLRMFHPEIQLQFFL